VSGTLVFIVAYEAERHLEALFERVPQEIWNHPDYHLLCIDDSSTDRSAELATGWLQRHGIDNATVLRNPANQGYGGNQKLGYRFAIEAGFDQVILLHGDGQYAPEEIPRFVAAIRETKADLVLGSRLHSARKALRGGMPLYKLIGNRILTTAQNLVAGQELSEYHTGYRAYSCRFLASVPFEINSNGFHFDTEILLQAFNVGAKIEEISVPTHYGDEICRVPGLRYALDVSLATLRYRMHRLGMMCSLRYRRDSASRYGDKVFMPYSSHSRALAVIEQLAPKTLLDLGCGPGFVARRCEEQGVRVTGVDREPPLEGTMSEFQAWDLETRPLPLDAFSYDLVVMLDVLEHLSEPELFLIDLRNRSTTALSKERPIQLLLTTPNVAFLAVRLNLLLGRFNYAERGILDITHKRLFTRRSLLDSLTECGYQVERLEGVGVPFEAVMGGRLGRWLGALSGLLARLWPSLFAFQFLVLCRPLPGLGQLLLASEQHLVNDPQRRILERRVS